MRSKPVANFLTWLYSTDLNSKGCSSYEGQPFFSYRNVVGYKSRHLVKTSCLVDKSFRRFLINFFKAVVVLEKCEIMDSKSAMGGKKEF